MKTTNKLLITGCMLFSITGGWLLGSFTNEAFSQSTRQTLKSTDSTTFLALPMKGETLPTIMLEEFSVIASESIKH